MNEVTLGDKIYISSKRAAEITGYAKDYVGQLSREGHIDAKMIGRSWYVYEPSIRAHRFGAEPVAEKASVQEATPAAVEADLVSTTHNGVTEALSSAAQTWNKPTYTAEPPQTLPELPVQQAKVYEEVNPQAEETLTDMQTAWKEWFDSKQSELRTPEIESPEVIDERAEQYESEHENMVDEEDAEESYEEEGSVEIPLHHLEEEAEDDKEEDEEEDSAPEPIQIRAMATALPAYTPAPARTYSDSEHVYAAPRRDEGQIISERVLPKREAKALKKKRAKSAQNKNGSSAPMVALLIGISIVTIAITLIGSGLADKYIQTFSSHNAVIDFLTGTRELNK